MLRTEFEQATGIYPSLKLYSIIEKHYSAMDVQKDTFCDAYKRNLDGLAERIQREADEEAFRRDTEHEDLLTQLKAEITILENQLSRTQEDLANLDKEFVAS